MCKHRDPTQAIIVAGRCLLAALVASSLGCATMFRSSSEDVSIVSVPPGATATPPTGRPCTTPCSVNLHRQPFRPVEIPISTAGCQTQVLHLRPEMPASAAFLAWGVGGLPTFFIGSIVDMVSGDAYSYSPNPATARLDCTERNQLEAIRDDATVGQLAGFLDKYPATQLRDSVEPLMLSAALEEATPAAYEEFLERFPQSARSKEIRERLEPTEFERVKGVDSIEQYRAFLDRFKDGRYAPDVAARLAQLEGERDARIAEQKARSDYLRAVEAGTYTAARTYLDQNPSSPNRTAMARHLQRFSKRSLERSRLVSFDRLEVILPTVRLPGVVQTRVSQVTADTFFSVANQQMYFIARQKEARTGTIRVIDSIKAEIRLAPDIPVVERDFSIGKVRMNPLGPGYFEFTALDGEGFYNINHEVVMPIGSELQIRNTVWDGVEVLDGRVVVRKNGLELQAGSTVWTLR